MAAELLFVAMVSEGDAAVRALGDEAAEGALEGRGVAAPVQEQNDLLLAIESLADGFFELRREDGNPFSGAHRLAHIDDADDRHLFVIGPFQQFQQRILALFAVVEAFHRWGG